MEQRAWSKEQRAKSEERRAETRVWGKAFMKFRFQDLDIWKKAAKLSPKLFALADSLENAHKYRFAEQLRSATLSITNNIAEGSGSVSSADFKNFLNFSRRSVFEVANMLILVGNFGVFSNEDVETVLQELDELSKMILGFMRNLKK